MNAISKKIKYSLVNSTYQVNVTNESNKKYTFNYPCSDSTDCTDYEVSLSPGLYKFEVYGASGGFYEDRISTYRRGKVCFCQSPLSYQTNVQCSTKGSVAGSGGYTTGIIKLKQQTKAFIVIGGHGLYAHSSGTCNTEACLNADNMIKGGYNGGGYAANYYCDSDNWGAGSGGGATDIRFISNDLYHRVIVAGGGGGTDNFSGDLLEGDDGSGGSGGGLIAQGYSKAGIEDTKYVATQVSGFTFGFGESPRVSGSLNENGVKNGDNGYDRGGAGSGWFGGFASHNGNGGGGGGSSFILTKRAEYPTSKIAYHDSFYTEKGNEFYAFINQNRYLFYSEFMASGVWSGNGFAVITILQTIFCTQKKTINENIPIIIILLL